LSVSLTKIAGQAEELVPAVFVRPDILRFHILLDPPYFIAYFAGADLPFVFQILD
jgi:hypothetical protein